MTTIIVPTAIVTGMGLIAAVILTVASKLMYVPVDERVAAIREVLPGANCGACGFAGCDDYAAAFTDNPGLSCSLCPVGGASVASQIAGIMGEEASAAEPQVAMVMCQGSFGVTREITENTYLRKITGIGNLYDVSVVNFPAYDDTSIMARAKNYFEEREAKLRERRHRLELLTL